MHSYGTVQRAKTSNWPKEQYSAKFCPKTRYARRQAAKIACSIFCLSDPQSLRRAPFLRDSEKGGGEGGVREGRGSERASDGESEDLHTITLAGADKLAQAWAMARPQAQAQTRTLCTRTRTACRPPCGAQHKSTITCLAAMEHRAAGLQKQPRSPAGAAYQDWHGSPSGLKGAQLPSRSLEIFRDLSRSVLVRRAKRTRTRCMGAPWG